MGLHNCAVALLFVAGISSAVAPYGVWRADSAGVPVRFDEGVVHGSLELRMASGAFLAHGDLHQLAKDGGIERRMTFHLPNSVFEETVTFTQRSVFKMLTYHLVQSGPAFAEDLEVTLAHSGAYIVKTRSHQDGKEKRYAGTLELPPDTYNGMIITIAKNLSLGAAETVHIVAFTPQPRIIKLELTPAGTEQVLLGKHEEAAMHIVLKPKFGPLLRVFASLKGKVPPDSHLWIVTDQIPAVVAFQGPMYSGPVWRVNLMSSGLPE